MLIGVVARHPPCALKRAREEITKINDKIDKAAWEKQYGDEVIKMAQERVEKQLDVNFKKTRPTPPPIPIKDSQDAARGGDRIAVLLSGGVLFINVGTKAKSDMHMSKREDKRYVFECTHRRSVEQRARLRQMDGNTAPTGKEGAPQHHLAHIGTELS